MANYVRMCVALILMLVAFDNLLSAENAKRYCMQSPEANDIKPLFKTTKEHPPNTNFRKTNEK